MSYKVHYFAVPGRAEVAKLCLSIGGIPYEDVDYDYAAFLAAKARMPFGQMPVLELPDGSLLAQSGAIDRYAAKLAGLYPSEPLAAARADEAVFLLADFMDLFMPSYNLPLEEKIKARQEILAGKGKEKLNLLSKLIESRSGYVSGDKLSYGDLAIFSGLSGMTCGMYDGVPVSLLDEYPVLKAFRTKIASEPAVKAHYERHGEGLRAAFKPDA